MVRFIKPQKAVSIVTDGRTNVNVCSIINVMVVAPRMPSILWPSLDTGAEKHNADCVVNALEHVIDEVQKRRAP